MTNDLRNNSVARWRIVAFAATCAAAMIFAACSDPLGAKATTAVQFDTLSAFAMTGTPATYPAAFDAQNSAVVRIGSDVGFDVAFDFTTEGAVQLLPARQVASTSNNGVFVTSSRSVGLQKGNGTFESITKAPTGGYKLDSVLVVNPGVPVLMQLAGVSCSIYSTSSAIYAKMIVDSIQTNTRRLFFRATVDPNCGYRSFESGVPKG